MIGGFFNILFIDVEVPSFILYLEEQGDEGVLELLLKLEFIPECELRDECLRVLTDDGLEFHETLIELRHREAAELVMVQWRRQWPQRRPAGL
jgi:hypothetical protein